MGTIGKSLKIGTLSYFFVVVGRQKKKWALHVLSLSLTPISHHNQTREILIFSSISLSLQLFSLLFLFYKTEYNESKKLSFVYC